MKFPDQYKILNTSKFQKDNLQIIPIRYEDRIPIRLWRNEQIFHLRQNQPLSENEQDRYFREVVGPLFKLDHPNQLLFSFLEDGICLGYGGLVHINWDDKHAEISFLLKSDIAEERFEKYWLLFLDQIVKIAFEQLRFHKVFTYAFDVRPQLYPIFEEAGFEKEAVLKDHCFWNGQWKNVVIHSKINNFLTLRPLQMADSDVILEWANDTNTRKNSFDQNQISKEDHEIWIKKKLSDKNCLYYVCEYNHQSAAFIRLDVLPDGYMIGINVNPAFRGKKISVSALKMSLKTIEKNIPVYAYIKPENLASILAFSNAGFTFHSIEKIKNIDALVYVYKTQA